MDISGHPISPILRVLESKRKPVAPLRVYVGKSLSLSSVVSASRVDASVWDGEECASQCSLERDAPCGSETQENTHLSKVGGRKRKECAVFDY
jgi:hypothetical protein